MFSEQGPQALRDCYRRSQERSKASGFHEARRISKASFTDLVQELLDEGHHVKMPQRLDRSRSLRGVSGSLGPNPPLSPT